MESKITLRLLRKYGTETTVRAMLSPERLRTKDVVERQTKLLASLIATLEKRKQLKRGHVLEILSRMEGGPDEITNTSQG